MSPVTASGTWALERRGRRGCWVFVAAETILTSARGTRPNRVIRRGVRGARILQVRGRASSRIRSVPVNPLSPSPFPFPLPLPLPLDGEHYLVVPRGETQCVRNIRAAGSAELRRGRTLESIVVAEVIDTDKAPISRAYLELWAMKIGKFFDGLTKDSSDTEINAAAPGFPVFRITPST